MTTKVQVRVGEVELTIESVSPLAVTDIRELLSQVQEVARSLAATPQGEPFTPSSPIRSEEAPLMLEHTSPQLHVNSVADRLSVKSGPELVIAAAAHLQVVEGKQSFSRKELLATMQSATSHYNQNMGSNLGASLKSLTASKLNQLNNGTFALKSPELSALRSELA